MIIVFKCLLLLGCVAYAIIVVWQLADMFKSRRYASSQQQAIKGNEHASEARRLK